MQVMNQFVGRLRRIQPTVLYLSVVSLLLLPVGCSEGKPQIQTAIDAYWQAIINPKWPPGTDKPKPNFEQAHAAMHPESRAGIELDDFNKQQLAWIKSQSPKDENQTVVGARLGKVEIDGESATAEVTAGVGAVPEQPPAHSTERSIRVCALVFHSEYPSSVKKPTRRAGAGELSTSRLLAS